MRRSSPALVVGQSGGPTAVINATLVGVIRAAREAGVGRIIGLRHGVEGLLRGELVDLSGLDKTYLQALRRTPAAQLGSCRYRLQPGDAEAAVELLEQLDAQAFVYIGGNDSADTAHRIHLAARAAKSRLGVICAPKTIDNDLPRTDHCPGYGSAARFVAQCTAEAGLDTRAMQRTDPIKLIEVMGRHAGWLAAAAWLGKRDEADAPHLVLLPERPLALDRIVELAEERYRRHGHCVIVLSENQPDHDGVVLGATGSPRWVDAFGHAYHDSPGQYLADVLRQRLKRRARVDRPGTIQRLSTAHHSTTDLAEAELVGAEAARLALVGQSDRMVTLVRQANRPYRCGLGTVALRTVANRQRKVPASFIGADGASLTSAFRRYALPLLGEPLPRLAEPLR